MRILLATMQYGEGYTQGTERYVATLADAMRRRGHEVAVLAGDPMNRCGSRRLGECVDEERGIYAWPTRGWMAVMGAPPRKLIGFLRRWRPDVVHLNTPAHVGVGLAIAARALRIPLVVTLHDFWWTCPKGTLLRGEGAVCDGTPGWPGCARCIAADHPRAWLRRFGRLPAVLSPLPLLMFFARAARRGTSPADMRRWLHRRAFLKGVLEAADAVICPSRTIRDLLGNAADAGKWRIIRNGIAADWFAAPRPGGGGVKSPADLAVGFAGAMAPHKGPHLLIEALRLLGWDCTRARLAGPENDPAYAERLRRSAVGLNADFLGCLSAAQMKRFLRGLDVLAVTSVWLENCPYVVLEAQAAGAVVVGPDRGGVAELIDDPALRYPMGSARGLAEALEYARTHPSVSSATGVPTEDQMADATQAVYQAVADETGGRPNP